MTAYDVNLIRRTVVPQSQRSVSFSLLLLYLLACALTCLAVVFFTTTSFRMIDVYAREADRLEENLKSVHAGPVTKEQVSSTLEEMQPDLSEIRDLLDRGARLTPILESIERAVPEGVWLTRIELIQPARHDGHGKRAGRGGGPNAVVIEGKGLARHDGEADLAIRNFAANLENDPTFRAFAEKMRFTETEIREISGREVIGFEITCSCEE